jgi:hypothetical protein
MNSNNHTTTKIKKADFFALPSHMRAMSNGPYVLTMHAGRETFVPVIIIE